MPYSCVFGYANDYHNLKQVRGTTRCVISSMKYTSLVSLCKVALRFKGVE